MRHDRQGREGRRSQRMWAWGLLLLILALPAPAAPPLPSSHAPAPVLLQPGQVRIAPVASTRRHLPGHYVFHPYLFPSGLATGADGTLYFISGGDQVLALSPSGRLRTLTKSSIQGRAYVGKGQFETVYNLLIHLAVTPAGQIYTLYNGFILYEVGPHNALRFVPLKDPAGRPLPDPDRPGYRKGGYPEFQALAASPDGRLYVSNGRWIAWVDPKQVLHPWVGSESAGTADGSGKQASFRYIRAMSVGPAGDVYVSDEHAIRRITPQGQVTTLAQGFYHVAGLAVGPRGSVYLLADRHPERYAGSIYRVAPHGEITVLIAGKGVFSSGLALDPQGNLYTASADTLYKITPAPARR